MEKSIEHIWKEGFLKSDALIVPKINNLYNQKSIHIIDKFKRLFRINLVAIVAFSLFFLTMSYFIGIPIMGVIFFVTLNVVVLINKKLLNGLEELDKGVSSYEYLVAFNQWIKKQVSVNKRMSMFLYPIIFLSFIVGFGYKNDDGMLLGERIIGEILMAFPDVYLVYGIPLFGIVIVLLIIGFLAFFGGRIYQWDLNIVYGRVFKKLDELMADIESLNS